MLFCKLSNIMSPMGLVSFFVLVFVVSFRRGADFGGAAGLFVYICQLMRVCVFVRIAACVCRESFTLASTHYLDASFLFCFCHGERKKVVLPISIIINISLLLEASYILCETKVENIMSTDLWTWDRIIILCCSSSMLKD